MGACEDVRVMTMKRIVTHPITIATALITAPFFIVGYYYCVWLILG